MTFHPSNWLPPAATLFSILSGLTPGLAQAQDAVTFRAGLSIQNDDNFFRAAAAQVSERTMTESVGVHVAIPYSLQRFELDAGLNNNQHSNFSNFDFVGRNYSAAWRWSYTPQLHGNVTTARTETLNAATDTLNPALRNRNTSTSHGFDAVYEWGGPWQLSAGATQSTSRNEQALIGQADNRANTYNAGVRYALTSGNSISYNLRQARGTSTNDYTLLTHEASGVWVASGNTTLNGRLAYVQSDYANAPQFDYNGFAGGINVNWRATSKITVVAGWQRDLSSYQTTGSTHTQTDSFTASPTWQISPKTSLALQYSYAMRHDLGSATPSNRKDSTQNTSIVYNWQPRPFVSLSASLAHARLSSNLAGLGYTDNLASLTAQFNF
jgi:exopolysaccharide biosynthesis operon protein EpsL